MNASSKTKHYKRYKIEGGWGKSFPPEKKGKKEKSFFIIPKAFQAIADKFCEETLVHYFKRQPGLSVSSLFDRGGFYED